MKLIYNTCLLIILLVFTGSGFIFNNDSPFIHAFKSLPVQHEGRIKPLDTVARNSLLILSGKQTIKYQNKPIHPHEWLLTLTLNPLKADHFPCFYINHPEVLDFLNLNKNTTYFCYNDLSPSFQSLYNLYNALPKEEAEFSSFQKQINALCNKLLLYTQLSTSLRPINTQGELFLEYKTWLASIQPGLVAIQSQETQKEFNNQDLAVFISLADRYLSLSKQSLLGLMPHIHAAEWDNIGQAFLNCITAAPHPILNNYIHLACAYDTQDTTSFINASYSIKKELSNHYSSFKLKTEVIFNQIQIFYKASILYLIVFLSILLFWLTNRDFLYKISHSILLYIFIIHTLGILIRIYLQGRPPVTNLYSSAVFIGWACVLFAIILERFYKNGFSFCVAGLLGNTTLIIAHHLSLNGDTIEMMRAVLNSNFWLSTHVITITLGYSAMFLSGTFGIIYILYICFSSKPKTQELQSLSNMAYATLCFAMLFSFVGTMLGGIWADMSWGRFWGWDPKENGALLIVLWCAIVLHARVAKIVKDKYFMILNIFGNIVTSWSWFGTNMLGVGLHSYGFIDKAFLGLAFFIGSQIAVMLIGLYKKQTYTSN